MTDSFHTYCVSKSGAFEKFNYNLSCMYGLKPLSFAKVVLSQPFFQCVWPTFYAQK